MRYRLRRIKKRSYFWEISQYNIADKLQLNDNPLYEKLWLSI